MKFFPVALSAIFGLASAKKSFSGADIKKRINQGKFDKKSLLRNSKPYGDTKNKLRKLDQEEEEWAINGYYSIQFDTCLNLKVQDDDLFEDEMIYYAKQGGLVSTKSYILFNVCQTEYCYYDEDDAKLTFITDVGTFFNAFVEYLPGQVESYCQGCEQNEDYCLGNMEQDGEEEGEQQEEGEEEEQQEEGEQEGEDQEEGEEGEEGEEEGEDGGERKLSGRRKLANNRVVEYIDCDLCETYECFEDEEQQDNGDDAVVYEFEDALEWLYGLSECQEIEDAAWNNLQVYAGLICSDGGEGVQVGVFLDDECTIYNTELSYSNYMGNDAYEYHSMSEEVVEYMFTNDFDCYNQEVEYINPYDEVEEEEEQEEDNGEAPEAAEWCQNLFDGDFEAVSMEDCGANGDEEQQEEDEEQEEDYNLYYYGDWYSYQLTEEQLDDSYEVCQVIKGLEGAYETIYDSSANGNLYDYKTKRDNSLANRAKKLSPGVLTVILLAILAVLAGIGLYCKGKKADDNNKKAPLINNGSMA